MGEHLAAKGYVVNCCRFAGGKIILLYPTLSEKSILYRLVRYHTPEVMDLRPLKKKISITIDEDVLEELRLMAEENDRSLSQYINLVLKAHIRKAAERK